MLQNFLIYFIINLLFVFKFTNVKKKEILFEEILIRTNHNKNITTLSLKCNNKKKLRKLKKKKTLKRVNV